MKCIKSGLSLLLLVCLPLEAGYIRGIELGKWCNSVDVADKSACVAYILGVHDTLERISKASERVLYCLPENTGSEQLYQKVVTFMQENPKHQHAPAASNVMLALGKSYPCQ